MDILSPDKSDCELVQMNEQLNAYRVSTAIVMKDANSTNRDKWCKNWYYMCVRPPELDCEFSYCAYFDDGLNVYFVLRFR